MYIIDTGKPFSKEEIIKSIEESIDSIKKYGYEDKINQITLNELYDIRNKLSIKSDEISFYSLVDRYVEIVNSMWKVYLSQRKDGEVKYLVHNLAHREYHDAYRYKTISTSLITDNFIAFYSQFGSSIPNGFIVDPIKISCASFLDNTIDRLLTRQVQGSRLQLMTKEELKDTMTIQEHNLHALRSLLMETCPNARCVTIDTERSPEYNAELLKNCL